VHVGFEPVGVVTGHLAPPSYYSEPETVLFSEALTRDGDEEMVAEEAKREKGFYLVRPVHYPAVDEVL
jgi:hypothetical protein